MAGKRKTERKSTESESPIKENGIISASVRMEIKDALGNYASLRKLSMAYVITDAVTKYIGFDMASLPKKPRKVIKYANKEEREKAQKDARREHKLLVQRLMDKYNRDKKLEEADQMERSLEIQKQENKKGK